LPISQLGWLPSGASSASTSESGGITPSVMRPMPWALYHLACPSTKP
jgi:hypothetical protein